jgi:hypothetical protein
VLKNISYSVVKDNKYELVGKALNCEFIIHQRAQDNGLHQYILIHSSRQPHPISSLTPSLICIFNFPTAELALVYFFNRISIDEILATILTSHQVNCIGSLTCMRDTFINPMLLAISTRRVPTRKTFMFGSYVRCMIGQREKGPPRSCAGRRSKIPVKE